MLEAGGKNVRLEMSPEDVAAVFQLVQDAETPERLDELIEQCFELLPKEKIKNFYEAVTARKEELRKEDGASEKARKDSTEVRRTFRNLT